MKKFFLFVMFLGASSLCAQAQVVTSSGCNQSTPFSLTAGARLTNMLGVAGKQIIICSIDISTAGAENIALVEGTGSTCGTGTAGMAGGATAATGWQFAANGGLTKGNGLGMVFKTATAADDVCLLKSGAGQISGSVQWGYVTV